jgi:hypothetical protein
VNLNYWYPVARDRSLKINRPILASVWDKQLVIYRDRTGEARALDNACAHRRVALHEGEVRDCRIVCPYHGWEYDPDGVLAAIPYWPAGKQLPKVELNSYPVQRRGGLIWVFPGDRRKASEVSIPDTSELESGEWFSFCIDNDFYNHYSIGIINGMDYYHFHLHRKYQPWSDIELLNLRSNEDSVVGEYNIITTRGGAGRFFKAILGEARSEKVSRVLRVHYLYPHHFAEVGDDIKVWAFFLPVNEKHVKAFITMYVKARGVQRIFRKPFEMLFSPLILRRIQVQDAWAGLQEQRAWELYPNAPRYETNPISNAVEKLLIRKWQQELEERANESTAGLVCSASC